MSIKPTPTKADALKRTEIALIKMGQAALGLDDETYRGMLATLCGGKTSCTALTWQERQEVIKHLKASGFVVKQSKTAGRAWDGGLYKLRAMWYALAEVGAVTRPDTTEQLDAAIDAWAKRQMTGPGAASALRFASRPQMERLIESMKKWCLRVDAPTEHDQAGI